MFFIHSGVSLQRVLATFFPQCRWCHIGFFSLSIGVKRKIQSDVTMQISSVVRNRLCSF